MSSLIMVGWIALIVIMPVAGSDLGRLVKLILKLHFASCWND